MCKKGPSGPDGPEKAGFFRSAFSVRLFPLLLLGWLLSHRGLHHHFCDCSQTDTETDTETTVVEWMISEETQ